MLKSKFLDNILVYLICIIITFISISVFHRLGTGNNLIPTYSYLLGIGFPLSSVSGVVLISSRY